MKECKNCGHQFKPFEHFVKLELRMDDALGKLEYLCENCFFDYALKKLKAASVKNDYQGNIEIDEEQEENEDIMRKLTTYNFDVKLEYLDVYKNNNTSNYYCVSFQVLARDRYEAQSMLEKWLDRPEQTGYMYKTWVNITPMASGFIIVKE